MFLYVLFQSKEKMSRGVRRGCVRLKVSWSHRLYSYVQSCILLYVYLKCSFPFVFLSCLQNVHWSFCGKKNVTLIFLFKSNQLLPVHDLAHIKYILYNFFQQGATIGIDDEDDSTFTITVDQKMFHFQGKYTLLSYLF